MARRPDPRFQRRQVGRRLRRYREQAERQQQDVADTMDWSVSKLIRIENATVSVSTNDLKALLNEYDVSDSEVIAELIGMAKEGRRQPWYAQYDLDTAFQNLLAYESSAARIRVMHPYLVHGLLQTETYTRALLRSVYPEFSERELDQAVEIRTRRQEQLEEPDGPELVALIDEAALERPIGGPAVMLGQLRHLLAVLKRPRTSIRIIPFSAGGYTGLSGSFVLIDLDSSAPNGADTVRVMQNPT
jgi:transcriptional regulator with XRE-family HTH domain